MYALILAGGSGTRLWPYSRSGRPKQFLQFGGPSTMLQETVARVLPLLPVEHILVATNAAYADLVAEQLPDLPRENIIAEPEGRGTAPCIGLAAGRLAREDPGAVMAVLSADHRIDEAGALREALAFGGRLAEQGHLVTLGVRPTGPSTGYGYIRRGERIAEGGDLVAERVAGFVEKPDAARAWEYLESGEYLWNAGIFVWSAARILEEIGRHQPGLAADLAALAEAGRPEEFAAIWARVETIAIDVAVMERTDRAAVIPVSLGWSDLGDWASFADSLPIDEFGNAVLGDHIVLNTYDSLIYGKSRTVATIGLAELLIIDTDDVLLICPRSRAQDVKTIVAQVRERLSKLA